VVLSITPAHLPKNSPATILVLWAIKYSVVHPKSWTHG
jgi:hypothetical protein